MTLADLKKIISDAELNRELNDDSPVIMSTGAGRWVDTNVAAAFDANNHDCLLIQPKQCR